MLANAFVLRGNRCIEPDPQRRRLFVQFLFSYKINPRTLLFLGYSDNHHGLTGLGLARKDRIFFLEVSYAWIH